MVTNGNELKLHVIGGESYYCTTAEENQAATCGFVCCLIISPLLFGLFLSSWIHARPCDLAFDTQVSGTYVGGLIVSYTYNRVVHKCTLPYGSNTAWFMPGDDVTFFLNNHNECALEESECRRTAALMTLIIITGLITLFMVVVGVYIIFAFLYHCVSYCISNCCPTKSVEPDKSPDMEMEEVI